jgi:spore cortex biosynthesis protein YabQ
MGFVYLQLNAFLVLLFTGIVWGGFFDLYRVFRSQIRVSKTIDAMGDLLFWVLVTILVVPLIYWATWLELRLYVWVGIVLGIIIYFTCLSKLLIPVFKLFWQVVGWLPGVLMNLLWRLRLNIQRMIRILNRK